MNRPDTIASLKASLSGSKILIEWSWINETIPQFVEKTSIFYMIEGDTKVYQPTKYDNVYQNKHEIDNVKLEAKYKICLRIIMAAKWPGTREPAHICTDISNQWELSAFFGSTAGALLALILIILLILFSKRAKQRQKALKSDSNDKPKRQRFDSAFESQFDSAAIREDTSFYDEYIISDLSFFDSSLRSSSENNSTPNMNTPAVIVGDLTDLKGIKKRASLIEEESTGGLSHEGIPASIIFRDGDIAYQNRLETPNKTPKSSILSNENKIKLIETSIDEVKDCDI